MEWSYYRVKIQFEEYVAGGIPKSKDLLRPWLEAKGLPKAAVDQFEHEVSESLPGHDLTEEESRSWTTFMTDKEGNLCIRDFHIKAMMRESANILGLTKAVWGLKNAITNGVFIKPAYISLGTKEAETKDVAGHVDSPAGKHSILRRYDLVEQPTIEFWLKVTRTTTEGKKVGGKEVISEKNLRDIFEHAQESGLGSGRKRSFGRFEVLEFEKVDQIPNFKAKVAMTV